MQGQVPLEDSGNLLYHRSMENRRGPGVERMQGMACSHDVQRGIPVRVRIIQRMLYAAVVLFTIIGAHGGLYWGARPHDEYLIDVSKPLRFEFAFEGKL